jgi:hypothetical protein
MLTLTNIFLSFFFSKTNTLQYLYCAAFLIYETPFFCFAINLVKIIKNFNVLYAYVGPGLSGFWKIVFFGNTFGNFLPLKNFSPWIVWLILLRKKIFNIVHNEIIMQRYQNIKLRRQKLSSSTWLSITLSFILLLFLIYKILLF